MAVGLLVFLLALMHGVFGSGFIPIIRAAAPTYAPLAFGIYFFGMLAGQLAIVASPALRTRRLLLPLYELVFAASLLGMAAMFGWQPGCLILGRLFEGFAGGLAVPLMFFWVCRSRGFGSVARRISIFNSLIALGFVIGPQLMAWVLDLTTAVVALASFGLAFVAAAAALAPALPTDLPPLDPALGAPRARSPRSSWFETFFLLFLAKCSYGFVLPFTVAILADQLHPLTLAQVMLSLSGVFIVGQMVGAPLARALGRWRDIALPLLLACVLVLLGATQIAWLVFPMGLCHSIVLLVGLMEVAAHPGDAREFALMNCLSDPGLLVGAALAGLGWAGVFALAGLGLVPLLRYLASHR